MAPALMPAANIIPGHVTTAVHDIMAAVTIMGAPRAITMAVVTRTTGIIRAGRTRVGATEHRAITRTRITAVIRTVVTTTTTRTTAVIHTVVTPRATTRQATAIADQRLQLSSSALADSAITTAQSTELSGPRL